MRLLTIGHSYVVARNRRLAHHMAVEGSGRWEVTAAAPIRLNGDLRPIDLEPLPNEACSVHSLPVRLGNFPHLRCYGSGLRVLMRQHWDVVHVWEEPYVLAGAQIARSAPQSACVVPATFQNIDKPYPPPFSYFERKVMARASGWIAFGATTRDALAARNGYISRPVRVIPPGIDEGSFRPDPEVGAAMRASLGWSAPAPPVVGYVGRFVPEKGIDVLLAALERTRLPWRALFIGGGPEEGKLQRFAVGHADRVRVATHVRHDDVPRYLNAMDVLCAPSQTTSTWREQFGRMLIEAMSCGVPVLASRSGEIPFVVGDAGVLVDEADVDLWALALERSLGDKRVRRDLAERGRARVQEHFAWPVVARAHLAFFEELLRGKCAA